VGDPEADEDQDAPNGGTAPEAPSRSQRSITASADDDLARRLDARISLASLAPPSPERVFNASAKLMIYRALELAGGRLTTPQERRGRWAETPRHELHARVGPITPDKADKVTEGAWNHVGAAAADLGVDPDQLHRLLAGYVHELLTRGIPHHDDLLYAALTAARRPAVAVAA
jgi:hypothetical protein